MTVLLEDARPDRGIRIAANHMAVDDYGPRVVDAAERIERFGGLRFGCSCVMTRFRGGRRHSQCCDDQTACENNVIATHGRLLGLLRELFCSCAQCERQGAADKNGSSSCAISKTETIARVRRRS